MRQMEHPQEGRVSNATACTPPCIDYSSNIDKFSQTWKQKMGEEGYSDHTHKDATSAQNLKN
jgi:hypothetical protein